MAQKFIGETSGKYWKQKNDETYVNEKELIKITDLDESESVDDDDLLIKGNASTGTMLRIKVANFLDGIKEKLLGNTDISSVGDGTVSGAIDALDKKNTELNSALANKLLITGIGRVNFTSDSITCEANTRTTATITFPSTVTQHSFYFPVGITSGNGFIQATCYNANASQLTALFHSISNSDSTITATINMIYIDY